jgi:hypothetical protein
MLKEFMLTSPPLKFLTKITYFGELGWASEISVPGLDEYWDKNDLSL